MLKAIGVKCRRLKRAIQSGCFGEWVRIQAMDRMPLQHISDPVARTRNAEDHIYRALEKKYKQILTEAREPAQNNAGGGSGIPKIIWWSWLQGLDEAPEITHVCLDSVRRHMPGYEIRLITEANYREYVELPDHVLDRWNRKLMCAAHFSDLLRTELLLRYGGVWIDATVFLTGDGLCSILDQTKDLFMPSIIADFYGYTAENWLIAACPDNDLLRLTRDLLYAYWKDHKLACDYMIYFLFFTMAAKRYEEQWHEVFQYCREPSFLLSRELRSPFSERRYMEIKQMTSIHKLIWKKKYHGGPGSFYDVLIHQRRYQ